MTGPMSEERPEPDVRPSFVEQRNIPPLIFALASLIIVFLLYQIGGGLLTYVALGSVSITPQNVQGARLVTMFSQLLFIFMPAILLARLLHNDWRAVFPMRLPSVGEAISGIFGLLALQRILESMIYFQRQIPLPEIFRTILGPIKEMIQQMMKTLVSADSTLEFFFVVFVVAVIPAVVEESYFRGLLQYTFARAWNPLGGAIVSGVVFGFYHLNPFDVIGLIGLGMFLGYLRYRSGSLALPVALHFFNNLLAVVAMRLGAGYEETLAETMGQSPTLGVMLMQFVLFGLAFALILRFYHRITTPTASVSV